MNKTTLLAVCVEVVDHVDGALGCALVHAETGLPLASSVRAGSGFGAPQIEVLCAAGADYFGESVGARTGPGDGEQVEEVQTTTVDGYLFMARVPGTPDGVLILALDRKATNLGLGWMAMRKALDAVRAVASEEPGGVGAATVLATGTNAA